MSNVFTDPLADVPAELHDVTYPYLRLARTVGRKNAEQISTYLPLPWSEQQGMEIIALAVQGLSERLDEEAIEVPEIIAVAMQRAMVGAMIARLDELFEASAGMPQGGTA